VIPPNNDNNNSLCLVFYVREFSTEGLKIIIIILMIIIVLQTAFLVKLDVSLRKKLRYNCLTENVFLYCFMDLKPVHLVSRIWARLPSHLIVFH